MRDRMRAVLALMKRGAVVRVALLALVAVVTSGAIAGCSRTTGPDQPARTVETRDISPPATPVLATLTPSSAPAIPTTARPTPTPAAPTTPKQAVPTPTRATPGLPTLPTSTPGISTSTPTSPGPGTTPTPALRERRDVPSEWQLRTRASPELAAQHPLADLYTSDEIAYFKEIAFGMDPLAFSGLVPTVAEAAAKRRASYGERIQKWGDGTVEYYIGGDPTKNDVREVERVLSLLEELIPAVRFRPVDRPVAAALLISFWTRDTISDSIDASRWPWTRWLIGYVHDNFLLTRVAVVINSDWPEELRKSAVVAGIMRSVGFAGVAWWYPDSIFYQGDSSHMQLADIDEALIRLLYDPQIKPGMTIHDLERMGL